jgi:hypothetical protein
MGSWPFSQIGSSTFCLSSPTRARAALGLSYVSLAIFGLSACAGSSVSKVEIPAELPQELAQKFDIKDVTPSPTAAPSATPASVEAAVPPPKTKKEKLKRKAAQKKLAKAEAASEQAKAARYPNRRPAKDPLWIGEKLLFEITYFGMAAGDFTAEIAGLKMVDSRMVYKIEAHATSSSVFSLFYRLNDSIESYLDYNGIFSHRFHLILDESRQSRDALELYDYDKLQTFYWNKWNHRDRGYSESKEYGEIQPLSQDSVSALYYVRTVPLPDGAVISFPVISEGKSWECIVTVVRREMVDSPLGKVRAVVVKPETKFQGVLQKRGDSFIWFTDDDRRIPLRLEAKVKIGTVVGTLKKVLSYGTPPQPEPTPSKGL